MASAPNYARILESASAPGTGTITLLGAEAGYQSFAVIGNTNTTPLAIWAVDASGKPTGAWETALKCTYSTTGPTITRGTFESSSTGSAVNFTGAVRVGQTLPVSILNGLVRASLVHIEGLLVTKNAGGNTLDISAGSCYDPSSEKIITYAGATGVNAGTLGASQWNQVYLYDNAGTVTVEVVNNAAPPATAYAGTARQGGTNSNRRWIGSFLTTSASNIYAQDVKETGKNQIEIMWLATINAAPFRVISAGGATSYGAETSLVSAIPRYAGTHALANTVLDATSGNAVDVILSLDGANDGPNYRAHVVTGSSSFPTVSRVLPIRASTPGLYYKVSGVGAAVYLDVFGFLAAR